jgi:hypothetical protein
VKTTPIESLNHAGNYRVLTPDDEYHRIHTYFSGSPLHLEGRYLIYTRMRNIGEPAAVCLLDCEAGSETVLGEADGCWWHSGASAWFCDEGRGVIWQRRVERGIVDGEDIVCHHDLSTGVQHCFAGTINDYGAVRGPWFIDYDADYPIDQQSSMGIYLCRTDGSERRCVATVDQLLAAHPHGKSIAESHVLLRLGAQISPDLSQVLCYLVTRRGIVIRDYFTVPVTGGELQFHGRLGTHVSWHADSRHVNVIAKENGCSYFPHLRGEPTRIGGLLGRYDTLERRMRILNDHRLIGDCHLASSSTGQHMVCDRRQTDEVDIVLYREEDASLAVIHRQTGQVDLPEDPTDDSFFGRFRTSRVHAHPTFSNNGRQVLFNSVIDGRVRICAIEIMDQS